MSTLYLLLVLVLWFYFSFSPSCGICEYTHIRLLCRWRTMVKFYWKFFAPFSGTFTWELNFPVRDVQAATPLRLSKERRLVRSRLGTELLLLLRNGCICGIYTCTSSRGAPYWKNKGCLLFLCIDPEKTLISRYFVASIMTKEKRYSINKTWAKSSERAHLQLRPTEIRQMCAQHLLLDFFFTLKLNRVAENCLSL